MNPKDFDVGILEKISHPNYTFFWVLALVGIGAIIFARANNNAYFNSLLNFSQNYNQKIFSSQSQYSPSLALNYLISITLFILVVLNNLDHTEPIFSASYGFSLLLGVLCFYVFKVALQYFIAGVFQRKNKFDIRNAVKKYQILGLVLLPISVFSIYQNTIFQSITISIGIILIVTISLIQAYNSIKESLQYKISLFYIILYLCTLEILPFFLLAKYYLSR